jgi:amidohydrolase
MSIDFKAAAEALREETVARRRDLHKHPEIAFEEVRTAGIVADELNRLGLEVQTGVGKTGVVGILEGAQDGPTVLWRADMDALPVAEENDVEYKSTVPGKMHACGHDGHTAIGLSVAKIFAENRDQLKGRIKFVFQPAEEIVAGAKAMIDDGALENPRPHVSLGLHLWNTMPVGTIGVTDGPVMAGSSVFTIDIIGRGGHAALPQASLDPVICAAHVILALQSIVSRNADPLDSVVLSVTQMKGSDADNIIPEQVELRGTFRTYTRTMRDLVEERIHAITTNVSAAMGCTTAIDIKHGSIPTVNDADVATRLRQVFSTVVPDAQIMSEERTMGAEDMAYFMQDVPGAYFFVGSNNTERGLDHGHHHPRFDFDEAVLPYSVALAVAAISDYVLESGSS